MFNNNFGNITTRKDISWSNFPNIGTYTTGETLEKLSHHEDTLIRYKVAGAINAFPELLDILSKDKDWIVRWAVLKNPRTSKKTRKILLNDEILQGR